MINLNADAGEVFEKSLRGLFGFAVSCAYTVWVWFTRPLSFAQRLPTTADPKPADLAPPLAFLLVWSFLIVALVPHLSRWKEGPLFFRDALQSIGAAQFSTALLQTLPMFFTVGFHTWVISRIVGSKERLDGRVLALCAYGTGAQLVGCLAAMGATYDYLGGGEWTWMVFATAIVLGLPALVIGLVRWSSGWWRTLLCVGIATAFPVVNLTIWATAIEFGNAIRDAEGRPAQEESPVTVQMNDVDAEQNVTWLVVYRSGWPEALHIPRVGSHSIFPAGSSPAVRMSVPRCSGSGGPICSAAPGETGWIEFRVSAGEHALLKSGSFALHMFAVGHLRFVINCDEWSPVVTLGIPHSCNALVTPS